ncbi:GNAT family N-acetyltransferase [Nanoarchaeota archaeon]
MIKIRKARLKDIPSMFPLWLDLMKQHEKIDHFHYELGKGSKEIFKKWIRSNIYSKNALYLVAEDNNKIVGYIGGRIEKRPLCFKIKENGYVLAAVVSRKYQNKGIGKKLTNEMLAWFKTKKVKFVELHANSKNKKGILAWKKMGFKENKKIMDKWL